MRAGETRSPVAVVVVTWNSAGWIEDCLESLRALERPPAEIVVVDSGSSDDGPRRVRAGFPEARLIETGENVGFCRGNNLGFAATAAPFVLALNPDARLDPRFLEELLPAFDDPRVGLAAGKLLRMDGRTVDSAGQELGRSRRPVDRGYGRLDDGRWDTDGETFGACGAAALYRRTMLDSVRDPDGAWFDEAFFAFYEDLDLAWRARKLGWRCTYRHRAVGYHARGGTAERRGRAARLAALLGRRPEIRFHILKNRYLTLLRNETVAGYLLHAPWIWARDLGLLGLALASPSILGRLWKSRALLARARRLRRLDADRPRHQLGPRGTA